MFFRKIYRWADKFEDRVRGRLSHYPLIYAFIGGAGIIIFWRGIWHSVDYLVASFTAADPVVITGFPWWDGPVSAVFGTLLLLATGLWVSSFIGNEILISGVNGEKRVAEKTEQEIKEDVVLEQRIAREIKDIGRRLDKIESELK